MIEFEKPNIECCLLYTSTRGNKVTDGEYGIQAVTAGLITGNPVSYTHLDVYKRQPLGGLHEIGKNITVFEYENEIIVVDCGLSFPEDDMLGIDLRCV